MGPSVPLVYPARSRQKESRSCQSGEAVAMLRTRVTDLFGIDYPIVQGGLQWLGVSDLVAAVSEAGGLGLITAGSFDTVAEFVEDIRKARELTSKPFGVNLTLGRRKPMEPYLQAALDEGVSIIFTSGHNPENLAERIKTSKARWAHVCTTIRHAKKAQDLGADAVTLVGYEAGGHPGVEAVSTMVLVAKASRVLSVPVIAAGGIADGRGLLAALALGAEGVQVGTRFMVARESRAHPNIKQALLLAQENETVVTERTFRNDHRVLKTEAAEKVLALEASGAGIDELLPLIGREAYIRLMVTGDMGCGLVSLGQCVGLINDELPAAEIVKNMVDEASKALNRLNGCFSLE